MTSYDIMRWDVILYGTNNKFPMIYFKPDKDLLNFFKENNNAVIATITDSRSIYDNKKITGVINSLENNIPTPRPNLFNKTGYYCMTLYCEWHGYPNSNGKVVFSGVVIVSFVITGISFTGVTVKLKFAVFVASPSETV